MSITKLSQLLDLGPTWHISLDKVAGQLVISNGDDSFCVPIFALMQGETDEPIVNDIPLGNTDPYYQLIEAWEHDKKWAKHFGESEMDKRRLLFNGAFPNPKEGTNNHILPDGRKVTGQYKISRKIDEAALSVTLDALRQRGVANWDRLVRSKPELAKTEWNTLSDENKLIFSPAVIATPGAPSLEIAMPKKRGR